MEPVELGDGEIGRLERHRAERDKTIRMTAANVGEVVVDDPCGSNAEIRIGSVIGLVR